MGKYFKSPHMAQKIKVIKSQPNVLLPYKPHGASLGHIIHSLFYTTIRPKQTVIIKTGITLQPIPDRIVMVTKRIPDLIGKFLEVRQDFLAMGQEIHLEAQNTGNNELELNPYSKITKILILKSSGGDATIVDSLDETERGAKGYGSTGVN